MLANVCLAQEDFSWWEKIHQWDGHTPWHQYLTISPAYFGPNALPVPEFLNGRIDSSATLEIAGSYTFSKGDKTKDFYTCGMLPLFSERMAIALDVIPYEWFATDTVTRDVRAARTRSGKGGAGGDIYIHFLFQLIRDRESIPDLLFRTCFRLPSGTNLRNARYTDAPGYFFDVSAGKNFKLANSTVRPYVLCGFYVYQTYDLRHLQNDCLLYGAGADIHFGKFILGQSVGGYRGYQENGDSPVVYRANIRLVNQRFDWKLSYQNGMHDYDFQRLRLSLIFHMSSPVK